MAARTYGSLPRDCFTAAQLQALAEKNIQLMDIRGGGCTDPSLNTCEMDANSLLNQHPVYDHTRGVYTELESVPFPDDSAIDWDWESSPYTDEFGYRLGDKVLVISRGGLLVILYVSLANGPAPAGPFDPDLWSEVCHVSTATPVGLPSISELLGLYETYDPDITYSLGTVALRDSRCEDHTCVYISNAAVPINTSPPSSAWNLLYCVPNNKPNKCARQVVCGPGRLLTDLSSGDRDLICAPVKSSTGIGPILS